MTRNNKLFLYGGIVVLGISYLVYNRWTKNLFYEEMLKRIGGGTIKFENLKIWQNAWVIQLKATGRNFVEYQQSFLNEEAQKLNKAMAGLGTDENSIYGVFDKFDSKVGLTQLVRFYNAKYGVNLKDELNSELRNSEKQKLAIIVSQKPDVIYL